MTRPVPIKIMPGLELSPTEFDCIARVRVLEKAVVQSLSWDRYVRLSMAAKHIAQSGPEPHRVLDIGGYDGALALFLDGCQIDLLDPDTTGGTAMDIAVANQSYQSAVAVDVLEHIEPDQRLRFLTECTRVTSRQLILNYPCQSSKEAQSLMLELTGNSLIQQHVEWDLPESDWVMEQLRVLGFSCELKAHSSVAVWVGQYLALSLLPEAAKALNKYLIDKHADESFSVPLYHLIVAQRTTHV